MAAKNVAAAWLAAVLFAAQRPLARPVSVAVAEHLPFVAARLASVSGLAQRPVAALGTREVASVREYVEG